MEPSEIGLALFLTQFAIVCFYYGFIARGRHFNWYAIGAFVILMVLSVPSVLTLWTQSHAQERLAQIGIAFHPSIKHAVGRPVGYPTGSIWKFEATDSAEEIYAFYRDNSNVSGWLLEDSTGPLRFKRDSRKLLIMVKQDWAPTSRIISFWFYDTGNK